MNKRNISQIFSLLLLHSSWGTELKWFCNPVLSCHSCVLSWFACPIGVFIHYSGYHLFPYFALGTVLLIGVLIGRLLCGWVCPFGFLQDLLYRIPTRKITLPRWAGTIKYPVLVLTVFLIPYYLGEETMYSFCRFCPASALQVTLPNLISSGFQVIPAASAVKLAVLAAVIFAVIMSSRAFCKVLCPIGALLAPLNFISLWAIKIPVEKCVSCKKCDKACPTNVSPSTRITEGIAPNRSLDCVVCHECQSSCPGKTDNA